MSSQFGWTRSGQFDSNFHRQLYALGPWRGACKFQQTRLLVTSSSLNNQPKPSRFPSANSPKRRAAPDPIRHGTWGPPFPPPTETFIYRYRWPLSSARFWDPAGAEPPDAGVSRGSRTRLSRLVLLVPGCWLRAGCLAGLLLPPNRVCMWWSKGQTYLTALSVVAGPKISDVLNRGLSDRSWSLLLVKVVKWRAAFG